MTANLLTLNSSKTEFLLIGLSKQLAKIKSSLLTTTHSARNLGFIFDEHLTFSDQISSHLSSQITKELACWRVQRSQGFNRDYYYTSRLACIIHMVKWRHRFLVTIQSPFCGYNTIKCVELNGEGLSCYSNKIESVSLRKCPYDHWLTNKVYLSAITVTNISKSFYRQDGGKSQLA